MGKTWRKRDESSGVMFIIWYLDVDTLTPNMMVNTYKRDWRGLAAFRSQAFHINDWPENKEKWPNENSPCYSLCFNQTQTLGKLTPLTGRRYLKEKDPSITPVSTATQSVSRLQHLLSGLKTGPSDKVIEMFRWENLPSSPLQCW